VPGRKADNTAYQVKLARIAAIHSLMAAICRYKGITQGKVICAYDGKSALERATTDTWDINSKDKQHNLC